MKRSAHSRKREALSSTSRHARLCCRTAEHADELWQTSRELRGVVPCHRQDAPGHSGEDLPPHDRSARVHRNAATSRRRATVGRGALRASMIAVGLGSTPVAVSRATVATTTDPPVINRDRSPMPTASTLVEARCWAMRVGGPCTWFRCGRHPAKASGERVHPHPAGDAGLTTVENGEGAFGVKGNGRAEQPAHRHLRTCPEMGGRRTSSAPI